MSEKVTITPAGVGTLEIGPDGKPKRVVSAVATMSGHGDLAPHDAALAGRLEAAMQAAITQAMDEGVSVNDAAEIKRRMMAARQAVLHGKA